MTIVSAVNFLQDDGFDSDCADVFSGWMSSSDPDDPEENPVNRHVRSYVYCGAVREIGSDAVEFLQERRANSALPQVRFKATLIRTGREEEQEQEQKQEEEETKNRKNKKKDRLACLCSLYKRYKKQAKSWNDEF